MKVKRYLFFEPHFFCFWRRKKEERGGEKDWRFVKVPHFAARCGSILKVHKNGELDVGGAFVFGGYELRKKSEQNTFIRRTNTDLRPFFFLR